MNELIENIFSNFDVYGSGSPIPVKFLFYDGHGEPYVTYQQVEADNSLSGDDGLIGYVDYYDFDIFSKGNHKEIINNLKKILKKNGFVWQPSRSGPDMYEPDTGYYHKTLNFAYLREEK